MDGTAGEARPKRRIRCCCGCGLAAVLVPLVIWIAVGVYCRAGLARELEQLRAEGVPLTDAELEPPPVPEDENALPLYLEAAKIIRPDAGGQADELPEVYELLDWGTEEELQELVAFVDEHEAALGPLMQAASRPHFRAPVDTENLVETGGTRLAEMKTIRSFPGASAIVASLRGDGEAAGERLWMGFRMVTHLSEGPPIEGFGWGDRSALDAAGFVMQHGAIAEPVAREVAEELGRVDYYEWQRRQVQHLRVAGLDTFRRATVGSVAKTLAPRFEFTRVQVAVWWIYAMSPPWWSADQRWFLQSIGEREALADIPQRDWPPGARATVPHPGWARTSGWFENTIDCLFDPSRTDVRQARRALLAAALGIEVYREERGAYPEGLAELAAIDWPMYEDVFSGQELVYRRDGDGYTLYSIGPDLTDDGGKAPDYVGRIYRDDGYDVVWGAHVPGQGAE